MKNNYAWFDGKLRPQKNIYIPLLTHSLHYGSAVFEGIRCYQTPQGPAVFRLQEHVKRFFHSARALDMRLSYSEKAIREATKAVVKKNQLQECYIRPLAFYGEKMGLSPINAPIHTAIAAWPWSDYLDKSGVTAKISSFSRIHPASSIMTAKISGHYANSIIATLDAKHSGFDEALLLDWKGNIAEGPGENIFFIKGKTLYAPAAGSILPGITRDSIMRIARDLGYKIIEKPIKPAELHRFAEAFFVGTAVEVCPIIKIDKYKFNFTEQTKLFQEAYAQAVHGEDKRYKKWLDLV